MPVPKALDHFLALVTEIRTIKDKLPATAGTAEWRANGLRAGRLMKIKPYLEVYLNLLKRSFPPPWLERMALDFEYSAVVGHDVDTALIFRLINCGRVVDGLRLLCLYSQVTNGVDSRLYGDVVRRIIGAVGIHAAQELLKFDKCGLLRLDTGLLAKLRFKPPSRWEPISKYFNCVLKENLEKKDEEGNDLGPADVGEPYDKYVPLLVRIVQAGLEKRWNDPQVNSAFDQLQLPRGYHTTKEDEGAKDERRKVLVFVIGGITESEAGIFHQLGSVLFDDKVEIHLGSTSITTGQRLITDIAPSFHKGRQ